MGEESLRRMIGRVILRPLKSISPWDRGILNDSGE